MKKKTDTVEVTECWGKNGSYTLRVGSGGDGIIIAGANDLMKFDGHAFHRIPPPPKTQAEQLKEYLENTYEVG